MMVKIQRSAGGGREHGQRTYLRGIEVGVSEGRRRFWGLRRRRSAVVCALAEASAVRGLGENRKKPGYLFLCHAGFIKDRWFL